MGAGYVVVRPELEERLTEFWFGKGKLPENTNFKRQIRLYY